MKLPRKPSRLIRLALRDLKKCDKDTRYTINMMLWHSPWDDTCHVCMAGAVMAKSLGVDWDTDALPSCFGVETVAKLAALNWFRRGRIAEAFESLNIKMPKRLRRVIFIPAYEVNKGGFYKALNRLADRLEAVGL